MTHPHAIGHAGIAHCNAGRRILGIALLESAASHDASNNFWLAQACEQSALLFDESRRPPAFGEKEQIIWPVWVESALSSLERLVVLRSDDVHTLLLAGRFFKATGRYRRAADRASDILLHHPDHLAAHLLAAESLDNLREFDAAETHYQAALKLAPEDPMTQWLYAMRQLASGRFEDGWRGYDARHDAFGWGTASFPFTHTRWQGEDLTGKTLLVHGEQGLGDEIMFASIIPEIIEEGSNVIVAASPTLADLFERSFGDATVIIHDRSPESVAAWEKNPHDPGWCRDHKIDYQCPIGSLARWRRRHPSDFHGTTYLKADSEQSSIFKDRLLDAESTRDWKPVGDAAHPLRVGLNLTANLATGLMGYQKSVPFKLFEPVFDELADSTHFISLHLSRMPAVRDHSGNALLTDISSMLVSLDATAALMDSLDVIVTTDTSVAHLAGGLGKPCIVLLKFNADWRYLDEGDRCIWYDSMLLVRQTRPEHWNDVVEEVIQLLKHHHCE
ncbi:MAG: hypothetical protein DHS20C01_15110 [marine bacterium B5-7]|nr:MAG: hypothetical protein DHS20C01_15110 [marine bacterium B5-7]